RHSRLSTPYREPMPLPAISPPAMLPDAATLLAVTWIPDWAWIIGQVAVGGFGLLLILGTLASLTRFPQWWIRGWDFPRLQVAVLCPVVAAAWTGLIVGQGRGWRTWDWLFLGVLAVAMLWQAWCIFPWLAFMPEEVADVDP